ncbi:hypothetical protein OUZ56_008175 [Daphnia magna]|uniref:Uncharacterized protein n=1 Tax=Daphnia magna TaxID=35525 RepID=A0ABR0ACA9_9CRUS|nr:hypothetical protein OUZ56_008175 [Daphnia magna]
MHYDAKRYPFPSNIRLVQHNRRERGLRKVTLGVQGLLEAWSKEGPGVQARSRVIDYIYMVLVSGVTFREPDFLHGEHRLALSDSAATTRRPVQCKRVSFPSQNPLGAALSEGVRFAKSDVGGGARPIYRRLPWSTQTMSQDQDPLPQSESWKPGWFTTCGKSSVVVSNFGNSSQSLQRVCDECTNQETCLKTATANQNMSKETNEQTTPEKLKLEKKH